MNTRPANTLGALVLSLILATAAAAQSDVIDYYNRGHARRLKGDFEGAIADYNHVIKFDPKNEGAYNNRGLAKQSKGDLKGAIADYTRSIALNPKIDTPYYNRGNARDLKGDHDGAIADFGRAIALHPKGDKAYLYRGGAKSIMRHWTDALADYRHACKLSEHDQDDPRLSIWLIRARLGETAAASKELSAYLGQRPKANAGDWVAHLAGYLLGNVTEPNLFAAAASPDAKKERAQKCDALYVAGMKNLFAGNKAAAADHFHKCMAMEPRIFADVQFAEAELKALEK